MPPVQSDKMTASYTSNSTARTTYQDLQQEPSCTGAAHAPPKSHKRRWWQIRPSTTPPVSALRSPHKQCGCANFRPTVVVQQEPLPPPIFATSQRLSVPVLLDDQDSPRLQPVLQSCATGKTYLFIRTLVHEKARVMIMLAATLQPIPGQAVSTKSPPVYVPGQRVVVKVTDRRMVEGKPRASLIENPFDEVSAMQLFSNNNIPSPSPNPSTRSFSPSYTPTIPPSTPPTSHCTQLVDAMQDEDYLYCAMPYFPNKDLYQKLESLGMGLPEHEAVHIFTQIAAGLLEMKQHHLAHRDVSLENIMFDHNNQVQLIDFGMCVRIPSPPPTPPTPILTNTTTNPLRPSTPPAQHSQAPILKIPKQAKRGKALYVSPEVYHETDYDPYAADMWSLGVVLYILLTNRPLYSSPEDQAYRLICEGRLDDLLDHYQSMNIFNVSPQARHLLTSMLHPLPEHRITLEDLRQHSWILTYSPLPLLRRPHKQPSATPLLRQAYTSSSLNTPLLPSCHSPRAVLTDPNTHPTHPSNPCCKPHELLDTSNTSFQFSCPSPRMSLAISRPHRSGKTVTFGAVSKPLQRTSYQSSGGSSQSTLPLRQEGSYYSEGDESAVTQPVAVCGESNRKAAVQRRSGRVMTELRMDEDEGGDMQTEPQGMIVSDEEPEGAIVTDWEGESELKGRQGAAESVGKKCMEVGKGNGGVCEGTGAERAAMLVVDAPPSDMMG